MAWDFSTEPEFQEQLDWMRDFVREEIWPLETSSTSSTGTPRPRHEPLQEQVKERGLWAAHLDPELGGQGFGQVKLGLMHEILGTTPLAPFAFGNAAPDSGNSEILALAGTPEQKERWLHPLLDGDLRSAFSMTEPDTAGSDPTLLRDPRRARRRRLGHQRAQVVLLERLDRRLPDRHGGHRPRRAAAPAGLDVHRPRRHARRARSCATSPTMEHPDEPFGRYGNHAEILYEDVRIADDALLGARGAGFLIAQQRLYPGRIHHCMRWLGVSRRAFDMLCERAPTASRTAAAGRQADDPELDRRLRGRDAGRAADDAARGVEDGHQGGRRHARTSR